MVRLDTSRRPSNGVRLSSILGGSGGVLYVAFIGLPVVALLVRAGEQSGFWDAVTSNLALSALRLSLMTSIISIGLVLLLGTPFAYLLARSDNPFARIVDSLVQLPIVLPPVVAGVAMLMAFGRGGLLGGVLEETGIAIPFTTVAVVFAQVFVAAPFYIRAAKLGFQSVRPEYEEISLTLGLSPWKTFWRSTFPLASSSITTGLGLAWARALAEFGATMMFAGNLTGETQTMPLAIMTALETSLDSALALSVLLLFGSAVVLALLGVAGRRRWTGRI